MGNGGRGLGGRVRDGRGAKRGAKNGMQRRERTQMKQSGRLAAEEPLILEEFEQPGTRNLCA